MKIWRCGFAGSHILYIFEKICAGMKQLLLKIASLLYGAGIRIRHILFDIGILHSQEFDIPVICVGNITVGGTGKTPAVEMLVGHLSAGNKVAVLSRGYGRATRGYREVHVDDSYRSVGDEPLQIKRKFPDTVVAVCEKRTAGISRILEEHPETEVIVMDDGFQHRYVKPFINIVMVDATRPVERDHLLPYGQLRDTVSSLRRAHYFLVTKCPVDMTPLDARIFRKVLVQMPYQSVYFTRVSSRPARPVFGDAESRCPRGCRVIAMSGIGNNEAFVAGLRRHYEVVATLEFEDHHSYRVGDLKRMRQLLQKHPGAVIVTTEKDAVKFSQSAKVPKDVRDRIFYEPIEIDFMDNTRDDFLGRLDKDLKQRENGTHIRGC